MYTRVLCIILAFLVLSPSIGLAQEPEPMAESTPESTESTGIEVQLQSAIDKLKLEEKIADAVSKKLDEKIADAVTKAVSEELKKRRISSTPGENKPLNKEELDKQIKAAFKDVSDSTKAIDVTIRQYIVSLLNNRLSMFDDDAVSTTEIDTETTKAITEYLSDSSIPEAWFDAWYAIQTPLDQGTLVGVDKNNRTHLKTLYTQLILGLKGTPSPAVMGSSSIARTFQEIDFSESVYEELTKLDVPKFDHSFPNTCDKLIEVLDNALKPENISPNILPGKFKENVQLALIATIDKEVLGKEARRRWRNALIHFNGKLEKSATFNNNSLEDWKRAFSVLSQGLKLAIGEDKDAVDKMLEGRKLTGSAGSGSGVGSGSGTYSGSSRAAVHHARGMSRIYRVHERRSYRIKRIYSR